MDDVASTTSTAERLLALLDVGRAEYRIIDHPPEGRTELASRLRGHPARQAAKCIVVRTKITKKQTRYVLAVVPGDRRVDLDVIRRAHDARAAVFADRETAERLARAQSGTIVPFAFDPTLELIVDPRLIFHGELYFNAAALDRSVAVRTADYVRLARPTLMDIAEGAVASGLSMRPASSSPGGSA